MSRKPSQSDWNRFESGARSRIDRIVSAYAAERIDATEFGDRMLSLLENRHARAGYLGRQRGGDVAPFDQDDVRFGALIADGEAEFLDSFVSDLAAGRYRDAKGELQAEQVRRRAQMYGGKLRATASEAWAGTAEPNDLIIWHLSPAEHCESCLGYAGGSPYRPDSLPTYPSAGHSECLTRCKCWISRQSDGNACFRATD